MRKTLSLALLAMLSNSYADESCYERIYTPEHLNKPENKGQILKSIQLKITSTSNTDPVSEDGLIPGYLYLLNGVTRDGKTYVYDNMGAALPFKTAVGIARGYSGEGPMGSFNFDFVTKTSFKLKVEDDLTIIEQNTFCNDALECEDVKVLAAKYPANNTYLMYQVPCDKLKFVKHKPAAAAKVEKAEAVKTGLNMSISYKGKMIYSLIKNKKLSEEQKQRLHVPANVDFTWKRYYELTQVDMLVNGVSTGLQTVNPADANAFAFDPSRTDVLATIFPEAQTLEELAQEVALNKGDVKWDAKGNVLAADLVGPLRKSGFLGSTAGASVNVDGTTIGASITVRDFNCQADQTLTKLICNVDYETSASMN